MNKSLLFAVVLAAFSAYADKVYLKSGSVLSGSIGSVTKSEVVFKSDDLGEVKIPLAKIVKLEDAGSHLVEYVDFRAEQKKLSIADGTYVADGKPLDMPTVKAIDPVAETWHGNINIAFNAARGNSYNNNATVLANINRRWEKDRFNADFGYYFGESGKVDGDNQKTTDKWEFEAQHDHFWMTKVYHYENAKWERDMIQQLRARYRLGLGGGYQWLDKTELASTGQWFFNQEIGANWVKEELENDPDCKKNGFAALRYGHHFGYLPRWTPGLEIFHNAEILPEVDKWDKYLVKADVGLSSKIIYGFDLLVKIQWEFNSKPAEDRKRSDIRYIVGLGYKW